MKKTVLLIGGIACVTIAGCAQNVQTAQDALEIAARRGIAEAKAKQDLRFERYRLFSELSATYACLLSKGSIQRNATEEEKARIEATDCR